MHYGQLLKLSRNRAGLTQSQMAKRMKIQQAYIAKLEGMESVQSRWLDRWANACGVTLCELLGRK